VSAGRGERERRGGMVRGWQKQRGRETEIERGGERDTHRQCARGRQTDTQTETEGEREERERERERKRERERERERKRNWQKEMHRKRDSAPHERTSARNRERDSELWEVATPSIMGVRKMNKKNKKINTIHNGGSKDELDCAGLALFEDTHNQKWKNKIK
jgi:hypothetical protein